jgi:hypothetical protein
MDAEQVMGFGSKKILYKRTVLFDPGFGKGDCLACAHVLPGRHAGGGRKME